MSEGEALPEENTQQANHSQLPNGVTWRWRGPTHVRLCGRSIWCRAPGEKIKASGAEQNGPMKSSKHARLTYGTPLEPHV